MSRRAKRGFATIVQEKSHRYSVRYIPAPGAARVSAGKTFARKADAEAWAATKRREIDRGARAQHERILFGDYSENWLRDRHVNGRPLAPRTREQYQQLLDKHLLPVFGGKPLAAITVQEVKDWHAHTLTTAPTYRSHAYGLLHAIMASAVNDDIRDGNPCRIRGAGSVERATTTTIATVEQLETITEAMPDRLRLMILLGSWCALRFGEVIELRRSDIDLDAEVIRIRRAAVRVKGRYIDAKNTKTAGSVRSVYIPENIIPAIEHHLEKFVGDAPDALLFPNTTGGNLQPSTFNRYWYPARSKADRDDLKFHDLRHTGATMFAQTGASLADVMQRLGHKTVTAALRYQHAGEASGRESCAKMSKLAGK